jgi:hypothetical protein
MLYLLGGAARSGKSIIAKRILAESRIPFFCLDHLAIGVANAIPQLQIDLDSDDESVGEKIWLLVKAMSKVIIKDKNPYLLEGASLQPKYANELIAEFPTQVRACFVGYADSEIQQKFEQIKQYGGGPDDWMMQFDDSVVRKELERLKVVSESLRQECQKYQLRYFETSKNFDKSVEDVVKFLLGQEKTLLPNTGFT